MTKLRFWKAVITMVAVLVMLFTLTACDNKTDDSSEKPTEWKKIGYILFPDETVVIEFGKIGRISSGWINVWTADGKTCYSTNERNVILVNEQID